MAYGINENQQLVLPKFETSCLEEGVCNEFQRAEILGTCNTLQISYLSVII
jgi:hypothetical protein